MGMLLSTAIMLMRQTAQRWERLLFAMGGALNHKKCYWYGIQWTFTPTGHSKMMNEPGEDDPDILLTAGNDTNNATPIERVNTSIGKRTLGVRLAPDGNDRDELKYRQQQATKMQQKIAAAPLGREYIGIGFRTIWQAMIQYPLGATCFTDK